MASSRSPKHQSHSRKVLTGILVMTLALGVGYGGYHFLGSSQDSENPPAQRLPSARQNPQNPSASNPLSSENSVSEKPKGLAETAQNWFEKTKDSKPGESSLPIPARTGSSKAKERTPVAHFSHRGKTQKIHKGSHKKSKYAKKTKKKSAKKALGKHKKKGHKASRYAKKSSKHNKHRFAKKSKNSRLKNKSLAKRSHSHKNKKLATYKKQAPKATANQ